MPDPLDGARLRIVLATVVINIAAVALLTRAPWSDWKTGLALNVIDNLLLAGFVARRRDWMLGRLMLFGLAVGLAELPADAWLVDYTRTLDYSIGGGPMLWRSPLWMPLAWEVVAVQFGYLGLRLRETFRRSGAAGHRCARRGEHSLLRGNGASHRLVELPRVPHGFGHAVLHHRGRIRYCHRAGDAGDATS